APVRTNYTLTEPDGTTTKLNEPGAHLDATTLAALEATVHDHALGARWVVLSGSLPPGAPLDWYATLVRSLRGTGAGSAVATADAGRWPARPPRTTAPRAVGAGDSSLAGYVLADLAGAEPDERLRTAVAYGAASASLPGSAVPTPSQADPATVTVTPGPPGRP